MELSHANIIHVVLYLMLGLIYVRMKNKFTKSGFVSFPNKPHKMVTITTPSVVVELVSCMCIIFPREGILQFQWGYLNFNQVII